MSQEDFVQGSKVKFGEENAPTSSKKNRRESILKCQMTEIDVKTAKNTRRVSFRNVKEVQIYNSDKNCPDLLHDSPPKREKINETMGSDGIFTPGRTTLSEISNHSNQTPVKNSTMAMFGNETQKNDTMAMFGSECTPEKPAVIEPESVTPRLEVQDSRPQKARNMDKTSYTAMDMSVSSDTSKMDDTLQMFAKSFVQPPGDTSSLNNTMDMFNGHTRIVEPGSDPANDTAAIFASAAAKIKKRVSLSSTMAMFQEPESPNDTMALFRETGNTSVTERQNEAMQMFEENRTLPIVPEEPEEEEMPTSQKNMTLNKSVAMDISMANEMTREVIMKLENLGSSTAPSNDTLEMFAEDTVVMEVEDKNETITLFGQNADNVSHVTEDNRVGNNITHMSMLQNNTILLTREADNHVLTRRNESTFLQENSFEPKSPAVRKSDNNILSRTMEIFKSSQETVASDSPKTTTGRKSELLEAPRRVNISELLNFSTVSMQFDKTVRHDKTALDATAMNDMSMDMDVSKSQSLRASVLSQSIRSKRRSLNTSVQDVMQSSPVVTPDPNLSMDEQLSFIMRNNLFDDLCVQANYLERSEGGAPVQNIRSEKRAQLADFCEEMKQDNKMRLSSLLADLKQKDVKQADAVEKLNARKLGAIDRDIMIAARNQAEADLFRTRTAVAKEFGIDLKNIKKKLDLKLKEVEKKAIICEKLPNQRAEVMDLEAQQAALSAHKVDDADSAKERNSQLRKKLAQLEQENSQLVLKKLELELAFSQRKVRETQQILMVLNAAKKEMNDNKQLLEERLRNCSR